MIRQAPLRQAMNLIQKERLRRKWDIHKLALSVIIDKTTAIYLLVIAGYIFISLFIVGDVIKGYHDYFLIIETQLRSRIWMVATLLPIVYMIQSFSRPGVVFSKTEYQLSILPYRRESIWLRCATQKWLKKFGVYSIIGGLIGLATPISVGSIGAYVFMLLFIEIIMTIPQWKLFQVSIVSKIAILIVAILLNMINISYSLKTLSIVVIVLLILVNIKLARTLFTNVNWGRVTEVSDFELWNMPLVARVSEVKMERRKLYSVFQNAEIFKSSLPYTAASIYQRLWLIHFIRYIKPLLQITGALILLLFVFMFINDWVFHLGIALTIHIYATVMMRFFHSHFANETIQILPWPLNDYKRTFFNWVTYCGLILLLPVATYLSLHLSVWVPLQIIFYIVVFFYMVRVKVEKTNIILSRQSSAIHFDEGMSYLFLISLVFSWKYPVILLSSILVGWLIHRMKYKQFIS